MRTASCVQKHVPPEGNTHILHTGTQSPKDLAAKQLCSSGSGIETCLFKLEPRDTCRSERTTCVFLSWAAPQIHRLTLYQTLFTSPQTSVVLTPPFCPPSQSHYSPQGAYRDSRCSRNSPWPHIFTGSYPKKKQLGLFDRAPSIGPLSERALLSGRE